MWVTAVSGVHPYQSESLTAKQTAAECYPQDLCLGKVLPCRAGITHSPHSHCISLGGAGIEPKHTWITPNSSQLCDLCQECQGDGSLLAPPEALLWNCPAAITRSSPAFHSKTLWIHGLRTKASGGNLSKYWAMDSYPGSSTVNLLFPLQLFIVIEAFSKRGILPISHYHNLNNLQYNLFHDRIWSDLKFPQAFRYTNKLLTAHLHFNSIYSLYTTSNL